MICLGVAILPLFLQAGEVKLETNKENAVYTQNEPVTFRVSYLSESWKPLPGQKLQYTLRADGYPAKTGNIVSGSTPAEVTSSLNHPGWIWIIVAPQDDKGNVNNAQAACLGVIIDPQELKPGMAEPADFDAFWQNQLNKINKEPLKITMTPSEVPDYANGKFKCFDVKIDCAGGKPVSGYFTKPVNAQPESLHALITYAPIGVNSANKVFLPNTMVFDINAHGIENGKPQEYYVALANGELKEYWMSNSTSKDKTYLKGMFLRAVRALDFVKAQPEWNGKDLIVYGTSQGGAQAMVAAALDPKVSVCYALVPVFCDHGGIHVGRNAGWPHILAYNNSTPESNAVVGYYDVANFAKRIKAETYMSVGFSDTICPPTSIYAAFNSLPLETKKNLQPSPKLGHDAPNQAGTDRINDILSK